MPARTLPLSPLLNLLRRGWIYSIYHNLDTTEYGMFIDLYFQKEIIEIEYFHI